MEIVLIMLDFKKVFKHSFYFTIDLSTMSASVIRFMLAKGQDLSEHALSSNLVVCNDLHLSTVLVMF
jgi:hypothetical protein